MGGEGPSVYGVPFLDWAPCEVPCVKHCRPVIIFRALCWKVRFFLTRQNYILGFCWAKSQRDEHGQSRAARGLLGMNRELGAVKVGSP